MIDLNECFDNLKLWLSTKGELVDEVTFLRAEAAVLKARVFAAQRSEADAISLMATAERAAALQCNDWTVHLQLASENARLRTALGEPMEAKK